MSSLPRKLIKNVEISDSTHETKQLSSNRIVSSNLPEDLIFTCILPLLSYKSLSRFKCVNKTWYSIISYDAKFKWDQSLHASPLSCGAVFLKSYNSNKIQFFNFYGSPIGINPRQHLLTDKTIQCRRILASASGLLCFLLRRRRINDQLPSTCYYVGNLATMSGDYIYTALRRCYDVGLAFDPIIDPRRYKLVHPSVEYRERTVNFTFWIYPSDKRKWVKSANEIEFSILPYFRVHGKPTTLKNIVYFDCRGCVVSFDPWKDKAGLILLPMQTPVYKQELGTWNGRITCTRMNKKNIEVYAFEKKWERMYNVVLNSVIDANLCVFKKFWHMMKTRSGRSTYNIFPFPYEGGDRLFFRMHSRKTRLILSYDLKSGKVEKLHESQARRVDEMDDMKGEDQSFFLYHNSMVEMPALLSK